MAGKCVIKKSSGYINFFRNYSILVDGKKIGFIKNGESKEFFLEPGEYVIVARIDFLRTNKLVVKIEEGKTVNLFLSSKGLLDFIRYKNYFHLWTLRVLE